MKELIIDSGAAMTRALRIDDGVVTDCWLGAAVGDEQQANFVSIGDVFGARVVKIDRTLRIGFLQLGARPDDPGGVLRFGPKASLPDEGALIGVEVRTLARAGKGHIVHWRREMAPTEPGRLTAAKHPFLEACDGLFETVSPDKILVTTGRDKAIAQGALNIDTDLIDVSATAFSDRQGPQILSELFARVIALPSGGQITIDETEGMSVIDVDTHQAGSNSKTGLNDKVNRQAAAVIICALKMRRIAGQVLIDFLPTDKRKFNDWDRWVHDQFSELTGIGNQSWTKSGIFSFTLPRTQPSVLERFTRTSKEAPVPGRLFTQDASLAFALCDFEDRLRTSSQPLRLNLSPDLYQHYVANPDFADRLAQCYGVVNVICEAPLLQQREFEIVESPR